MQPLATLISRRCRTGTLHNPKSYVKICLTMLLLVCGLFFNPNNSAAQSCNSFGIDFKQAANKDGGYQPGEIHWIGSILQNSNSRYIEGMSTLQRVVMNNLPSCNGYHRLRIKMETTKNGHHAYDFITSWDNAIRATADIAPGFDLFPTSRTDAVNQLHECGDEISACAGVACNLVTGSGSFFDLPVIFSNPNDNAGPGEGNLAIIDPVADQNNTRNVIANYEARYGDNVVNGVRSGRTVRVYVNGGSFQGTNGDIDNRVVFAGYGDANAGDGGDTYLYYDIYWRSTSPNVVIEYGAHIAVGVDGTAPQSEDSPTNSLGVGYLIDHGASSINGGPYHNIIEDFQDIPGKNSPKCEGNLGNLDNQLQGSEILLIPSCDLQGPDATCADATETYTAAVKNPENATYLWEIINSNQTTKATFNGSATGNVPAVASGQTTSPLSITVNTGSVGTYTVKLTITNGGQTTNNADDDIISSCTVTTTVGAAPTLTCPQATTLAACTSASAITNAFNAWLASVQVTGGSATRNPTNPTAPGVCGGTTSVTWTVTNDCGTKTCASSFTVTNAPAVVLTCAQNTTVGSCLTSGQVSTLYSNWLASATASGGCGLGTVTNNGGSAPNICGGSKTVTFTVTSACENPKTCSATFTVTNAPAVVLTCAQNTTVGSCLTQGQVNTLYSSWLATATASGGCNLGTVTNNGGDAPNICGGSKTVTFTVTSSCEVAKTCSATFTITNAPAVVLTCPQNTTVAAGQTQQAIDNAYTAWLGTVSASGGCNLGTVTNNGGSAPAACGGSKTVTFSVTSSCEAVKTCSALFTVTAQTPVSVTCPQNTTISSCSTGDISTAFTNWLNSVSSSGGTRTQNPTSPTAPGVCGGTTTVTWTVTNSCFSQSCSASFTVAAPTPVVLTCAQNTTVGPCLTQGQVDAAYTAWKATAIGSGGCNRGSVTNNGGAAPNACSGGTISVTFTVTSTCETKTCSASFTVTAAPALVLTCAQSTTIASCTSQSDVTTAYNNWLASAIGSGGCNRGSVTNTDGGAPNACTGGTISVTFTVTSSCDTKTCAASFTVTAAPALVLTCAQNTTVGPCLTQGQVDAAYTAWKATAIGSGGCARGSVTNNGGAAPNACTGGTISVTFTVTSSCDTKTCAATFTVTPAPAVVLTCAANTTVNSCQTQGQVDAAFANWLTTATASGGCGRGSVTNTDGAAPNKCGGSKTVTFSVTSSCEATKTCSATFTVAPDNTAPVFTVCPANTNAACGTTSPTFGTPTATDNCGGTITPARLGDDIVSGSCPTTYTRKWIATDACGNTATCSQTISVPCCASLCTYTQGKYGQDADVSAACDGTTSSNNPYTPSQLIEHDLLAYGGLMRIGCLGHSVTIATGEASCVLAALPGGGKPGPLTVAGDFSICNLPSDYLKDGVINNSLLAQTITLGLNLGINPPGLGNFELQVNKYLITADLVSCGSTTVKDCEFGCTPVLDPITQLPVSYTWTVTYTPYHVTDCRISQALYNALGTKDVKGLFALANSALCGNALPTGVSYGAISNAVDCINNAFDECRAFVGWSATAPDPKSLCTLPSSSTPCPPQSGRITTTAQAEAASVSGDLKVSAYPNPFRDKVSFVINSRYSGQASLEIYNMLGQRIQTVYTGNIVAGQPQIVEYRASRPLNSGVIYVFKQNGKQVTGKLLNIQE